MNEQDLSYALAKQVPDMQSRGFTIGTAYGDITIPAGWMADRLAAQIRLVIALELARLRNGL